MLPHYLNERDNAFRNEFIFDRNVRGRNAIVENGFRQVFGLPGKLVAPIVGLGLSAAYDAYTGRNHENKRRQNLQASVDNWGDPLLIGVETNPGPRGPKSMSTAIVEY